MPLEDEMQVGVFWNDADTVGSMPIEMGGGEGNLVRIWGCHWIFEVIRLEVDLSQFIGVALSSNPEHERVPLVDQVDFQSNKAVYARATMSSSWQGVGSAVPNYPNLVIPVYGLVRPRRQMMVWSLFNAELQIGLGLEVYYQPFGAPSKEREEVNRKYGKYRRT